MCACVGRVGAVCVPAVLPTPAGVQALHSSQRTLVGIVYGLSRLGRISVYDSEFSSTDYLRERVADIIRDAERRVSLPQGCVCARMLHAFLLCAPRMHAPFFSAAFAIDCVFPCAVRWGVRMRVRSSAYVVHAELSPQVSACGQRHVS
jgi:hypothetical protein